MKNLRQSMRLTGGLSGCSLYVKGDRVIKTSSDFSYNNRLELQMRKQMQFHDVYDNVIVPPVIDDGVNSDGLFFFSMRYEKGLSFFSFFNTASPEEIRIFTKSIINYIEKSFEKEFFTATELRDACTTKIGSLVRYLDPLMIEFIMMKIEKMKSLTVQRGRCHGDLTMSNILVKDGIPIFIDFLDSYIESPLIDLIKLKQDLYYFWSFLKDFPESLSFRAVQASSYIWERIENYFSSQLKTDEFKVLEFMNFVRIYPYAKSPHTIEILDKIVKRTIIYEEFNRAYRREII